MIVIVICVALVVVEVRGLAVLSLKAARRSQIARVAVRRAVGRLLCTDKIIVGNGGSGLRLLVEVIVSHHFIIVKVGSLAVIVNGLFVVEIE
jgi:hypothetical protein